MVKIEFTVENRIAARLAFLEMALSKTEDFPPNASEVIDAAWEVLGNAVSTPIEYLSTEDIKKLEGIANLCRQIIDRIQGEANAPK